MGISCWEGRQFLCFDLNLHHVASIVRNGQFSVQRFMNNILCFAREVPPSIRKSEIQTTISLVSRHLANGGHGVISQTFSDQNFRETLKNWFSHILSYAKYVAERTVCKMVIIRALNLSLLYITNGPVVSHLLAVRNSHLRQWLTLNIPPCLRSVTKP